MAAGGPGVGHKRGRMDAVPSRIWAAVRKLVLSLLCLGFFVYSRAGFAFDTIYTPAFRAHPFLLRCALMWVFLLATRTKYYFAWSMTEGSANLAGFGYRRKEGDWNGARNVDILAFEMPSNMTDATKQWNMQTQQWLARYCNQRLPQGINVFATYMLSAFWHGFYPGYYLTFLSAAVAARVEKAIITKISPRMHHAGPTISAIYDGVSRVFTNVSMNYFVVTFVALGWDHSVYGWGQLYFVGHIVMFVFLVVLQFVPAHKHHNHEHVHGAAPKHATAAHIDPAPGPASAKEAAAAADSGRKSGKASGAGGKDNKKRV